MKLAMLEILQEKYGMVEEDFLSAELMAVPAAKAVDIGLDRSVTAPMDRMTGVCLRLPPGPAGAGGSAPADWLYVCWRTRRDGSLGVTGMQSAGL